MKIGLYGVSRSGKNYLIDKVLSRTSAIKHISGSATLKEMARTELNMRFDDLSDSQKNNIRSEFTKRVMEVGRSEQNIIVDGHYSFPQRNAKGYDVVFTEADKSLYDIFIYMNTPSERIVFNAKLGNTGRKNTLYDVSAITDWKNYEIAELRNTCRELNKELIIFDGNMECCCDFLCDLLMNPEYFMSSSIVKRIISDNQVVLNNYDTVMLIDCDRTITLNDTTYDFCKNVGIDTKILKEIYNGEHYSVYQFYRANKQYDDVVPDCRFYEACSYAADKGIISERLLADIRIRNSEVCVIGITSGIANIWSRIASKMDFPKILIGKDRGKMNGYFISTTTKYMLTLALKEIGKKVIAIGDSMIDIQMLETANSGYIATGDKINAGVEKYFATHIDSTQIKQLNYNTFKYNGVKEVGSIWE